MNYQELTTYIINKTPENEHLDYKEAFNQFDDKEKLNIAKIVCALANAGGGIIIYGVDTDKTIHPEVPTQITGLHSKNPQIIEQVVKSMISPSIPNCIPGKLVKDNSATPVAYIITVPDSEFIPHQSLYDHVFYGRVGSNSKPLDYTAVERLFNTQRKRIENIPIIIMNCFGGSLESLGFKIRNVGGNPAINIKISLGNTLIIQYQCLSSNLEVDRHANLSHVPELLSPEYKIEYQDISGASYEIIIQGNKDGLWYSPKPEISYLSRNKKTLIKK